MTPPPHHIRVHGHVVRLVHVTLNHIYIAGAPITFFFFFLGFAALWICLPGQWIRISYILSQYTWSSFTHVSGCFTLTSYKLHRTGVSLAESAIYVLCITLITPTHEEQPWTLELEALQVEKTVFLVHLCLKHEKWPTQLWQGIKFFMITANPGHGLAVFTLCINPFISPCPMHPLTEPSFQWCCWKWHLKL